MVKVSAGVKNGTPGAVESSQVPAEPVHVVEDTIKPVIENMTKVNEVNQKENIQIVADASDDREVKTVRLFYRPNHQQAYAQVLLAEDYDDMMYHHTIYSPEIIGNQYMEYYFIVSDGANEVTSETYKITITSDLDDSSLRLNVKSNEIVSKEKILKGTSKSETPDQVKLFIDGTEVAQDTYHSLEHDAYFAFEASGVDTLFPKWRHHGG